MWYPPWPYPVPMGAPPEKQQDPIKLYKKWTRFLEQTNADKKKKEKAKGQEPWDQVYQLSVVLMVSAIITGPMVLFIAHMLLNQH